MRSTDGERLSANGFALIEEPEHIPDFDNEAEEAAYWETHTLGEGVLKRLQPAREVDPRLPPARRT